MIYRLLLLFLIIISSSFSNVIKYAAYLDIVVDDSVVYLQVKKINQNSNKKISYKINLKKKKVIINDSTKVDYPLDKIGISNVVQAEILNMFNKLDRASSIAGSIYITSKEIKEKIKKYNIIEVGTEYGINLERVIKSGTKVFLINKPGSMYDLDNQLNKLNLPSIISSEWIENSLLGRTEWIKFFGWLLGCPEIADSIFKDIENRYYNIVQTNRIKYSDQNILWGSIFNGSAWIVGKKSFVCNMFNNIGIKLLNNDFDFISSPISLENFFTLLKKTDIFIVSNNLTTYEQFLSIDPRIKKIIPPATKVYSVTNEYYESSILTPDILIDEIYSIVNNNPKKGKFFRRLELK